MEAAVVGPPIAVALVVALALVDDTEAPAPLPEGPVKLAVKPAVEQAVEPAEGQAVEGSVVRRVETYPDCGGVPSPAPSPVRIACTEFTPFRRAHAPGPWSIGPNGPVYGAMHGPMPGVMPGVMPAVRHTPEFARGPCPTATLGAMPGAMPEAVPEVMEVLEELEVPESEVLEEQRASVMPATTPPLASPVSITVMPEVVAAAPAPVEAAAALAQMEAGAAGAKAAAPSPQSSYDAYSSSPYSSTSPLPPPAEVQSMRTQLLLEQAQLQARRAQQRLQRSGPAATPTGGLAATPGSHLIGAWFALEARTPALAEAVAAAAPAPVEVAVAAVPAPTEAEAEAKVETARLAAEAEAEAEVETARLAAEAAAGERDVAAALIQNAAAEAEVAATQAEVAAAQAEVAAVAAAEAAAEAAAGAEAVAVAAAASAAASVPAEAAPAPTLAAPAPALAQAAQAPVRAAAAAAVPVLATAAAAPVLAVAPVFAAAAAAVDFFGLSCERNGHRRTLDFSDERAKGCREAFERLSRSVSLSLAEEARPKLSRAREAEPARAASWSVSPRRSSAPGSHTRGVGTNSCLPLVSSSGPRVVAATTPTPPSTSHGLLWAQGAAAH